MIAAADVAHGMAGAADALNARGGGLGRVDLNDEVDVADVDAELERRGRDEAAQLARLQHALDLEPPLARQAAVMGARQLVARMLVSRSTSRSHSRRLFTKSSTERAPVHERHEPFDDRLPDAFARARGPAQVRHRHADLDRLRPSRSRR